MTRTPLALALLLALGTAPVAAADTPELNAQRIAALEARIQALEANADAMREQTQAATAALEATRAEMEAMKSAVASSTPPGSESLAPADGETGTTAGMPAVAEASPAADAAGANGNAFNPAITVILNGAYTAHSLDPDAYARSGFPQVGEGGPSARGFSLGESEISFAAAIDDKLYGQLTVALGSEDGETEVAIEEAYIETTGLANGFTARAGRFFSGIGYLNGHHAHTDKFYDRPLPYQAFVGNQYGDDGVQLRWVAPTDTFLEIGGEVFRGDSFPAGGAARKGAGSRSLFVHAGGDVGDETSWLAGVSVLDARSEGAEDGFSGDTRLWIADVTWKWAPGGNFKDGGVTLRGEYFLEDRDGEWSAGDDPVDWNGRRHGAYVEGTYRIDRRWETGYRYDRLWSDSGLPLAEGFAPARHSLMLSWINSEFSLLRLQLSRDTPNDGDADTALTLQYQTALGAHGAHKF
jgi:hypothetical protein